MQLNRRGSIIMLFILLIGLTACQTTHAVPNGYYAYNIDKVESAVDQLTFTPELPGYIPFNMVSVVSDKYEENDSEVLDLSFYTKANDFLSIQFVAGDANKHWNQPESVKISKQVEGKYEDNQFSKRLRWKKDGVTYILAYRASVDSRTEGEQGVTREDLIEVARSFHL